MSALCAYPSLIPSSGAFPSFADIRTSVNGNHYGSYPLSIDTTLRNGYTSRSSFAAQIYPYSTAGTDFGTKTGAADVKSLQQQQQQQQQHNSVADALSWQAAVMVQASSAGDRPEPAAKRRCTDKSRNVWPDQVWPSESVSSSSTTTSSSAAAAPSNLCPSGCAMCHQQQQQQQLQQQQQQQQHYHSSVLQLENASHRRPLQERHQNRLFSEEHSQSVVNNNSVIATQSNKSKSDLDYNNTSSMMPQLMLRQSRPLAGVASNNSRQLSVDLKKDYSLPLHVDCSVEYDLPRVVRPPPGAQPLLMLAPRRAPVATVTSATATLVAPAQHMTRESIYQTMVANNGGGTAWNAARAAVNWTTPKNDKLNKSASQSNVMKNIALPVVAPVATPAAPNLITGAVRNGGGQCACPSCLGRSLYANSQSAIPSTTVRTAWNHWSPPVGATAAAAVVAYQQQQQQQQQRAAVPFQMASGVTYIDQQQQQVTSRRRKRQTVDPSDKMDRLYANSAAWMTAQSSNATADAAFMAANRFIATPWMATTAPLKFPC